MYMNKDLNKGNRAASYDQVAREIFLPVFPVIAKEALKLYGKEEGICLDVGCGGGLFGYFVALLSKMSLHFTDVKPEAIETCRQRGLDWGLDGRCTYSVTDVHQLDLPSDTYDLIISRGSIPFWGEDEELVQAFREIYRVLAVNGVAMIGGSLGTPEIQAAVVRRMRERNPDWAPPHTKQGSCVSGYDQKSALLSAAGIPNRAQVDDSGHWIVLRK